MEETKTFFLNGEEYFSDKIINLLDIVSYFNYNSSLLVLEYNNYICPKKSGRTFSSRIKIILKLLLLLVGVKKLNFF